MRGHIVRLESSWRAVTEHHDYPDAVTAALGEAVAASALLAGTIKFDGQLTMQFQGPGPVHLMVVQCSHRMALRGVAHAAIDVSDGLLGDLGHILARSGYGAQVQTRWLEGSSATSADLLDLSWNKRLDMALAGGDDYELLFTAPRAMRERVNAAAHDCNVAVTCIGHITEQPGLRVLDEFPD